MKSLIRDIRQVLIVEDDPDTMRWLKEIIEDIFSSVNIKQAMSLQEAKKMIRLLPDLTLIDIQLPDGNGIDLLQQCATEEIETCAIVCTVHCDDQYVFSALRLGASGYLLKGQRRESFKAELSGIIEGRPPLSPEIAHRLLDFFQENGDEMNGQLPCLTKREEQVLTLIGKGLKNKQIAHKLNIATSTTAGYIKTIYKKLKVRNRAEAAIEASRRGLML